MTVIDLNRHTHSVGTTGFLCTEWVDYVEEPMKYQTFMHHIFYVGGWLKGSWGGRWGEWIGGGGVGVW